jgi:hypothetical protein
MDNCEFNGLHEFNGFPSNGDCGFLGNCTPIPAAGEWQPMSCARKQCDNLAGTLLFDEGAVYLGHWICEECSETGVGYWYVVGYKQYFEDSDFQLCAQIVLPEQSKRK